MKSKSSLNSLKKGYLVLNALLKYGVMSKRTLQVVVPEIKETRNLEKILKRLCDKGLVAKRYDQIDRATRIFYQLNQDAETCKIIAQYLKCDPSQVVQRYLRHKELFHEQTLIKFLFYLERQYPHFTVLRQHELYSNSHAQEVIDGLKNSHSLKPDLLIVIPVEDRKGFITIALEYEIIQKSKKRVKEKLDFYTQHTKIDGVIYIYSKSCIDHIVHSLYVDKVLSQGLRIQHYGKNFLLTSPLYEDVEKSLQALFNRDKHSYSFADWIMILTRSSAAARRDENFKHVTVPTSVKL